MCLRGGIDCIFHRVLGLVGRGGREENPRHLAASGSPVGALSTGTWVEIALGQADLSSPGRPRHLPVALSCGQRLTGGMQSVKRP